jgi:mono/diheme cytochrome c family protein
VSGSPTRSARVQGADGLKKGLMIDRLAAQAARSISESAALALVMALVLCNPGWAAAFPWSIDVFRGDAVQPMAEAPRVMPPDTLPVDGERPRSTAASRKLQNPLAAIPKNIEEGGKLYSVYCLVCHGAGGHGDGAVRFMLRTPPADLTSDRVVLMKDGSIYGTIRNGTQIMPSYGDALAPTERWHIVLFVRHLQERSARANNSPSSGHSPHPRTSQDMTGK